VVYLSRRFSGPYLPTLAAAIGRGDKGLRNRTIRDSASVSRPGRLRRVGFSRASGTSAGRSRRRPRLLCVAPRLGLGLRLVRLRDLEAGHVVLRDGCAVRRRRGRLPVPGVDHARRARAGLVERRSRCPGGLSRLHGGGGAQTRLGRLPVAGRVRRRCDRGRDGGGDGKQHQSASRCFILDPLSRSSPASE
jgi:hypothetical protein